VRKQDEERIRQEEADTRRREEEERRRKKAMEQALDRATDVRADDEDAPGFEEGHAAGRSLDPESLKNKLMYLKRVEIALSSQLQVPRVIPAETLKRLQATVSFKVDAQGKVQGEPKLVKSSGNNFFDEAALTAVRKFGPGSQLRIPMPIDDDDLAKIVLRDGLKPTMDGARINR
jgi:TonB family protein